MIFGLCTALCLCGVNANKCEPLIAKDVTVLVLMGESIFGCLMTQCCASAHCDYVA